MSEIIKGNVNIVKFNNVTKTIEYIPDIMEDESNIFVIARNEWCEGVYYYGMTHYCLPAFRFNTNFSTNGYVLISEVFKSFRQDNTPPFSDEQLVAVAAEIIMAYKRGVVAGRKDLAGDIRKLIYV